MSKRYHIVHNILLYSVFVFYLFILFTLLFMKRTDYRSVNIIPFHSIISYLSGNDLIMHSFALSNVAGNILLFIPLGGYVTLFSRDKHIFKNVLLVILFSILAEIIQFIFKLGATDIDDVLLNGSGGFIGVVMYRLLLLLFKDENTVRYAIEIIAPITGIIFFVILFLYNMV